MSAKEERKKLLEQFMKEPFPRNMSLMDRLKGKDKGDYTFEDLFTLAGCIYKTMAWGTEIISIEKYIDGDEDFIILPNFLQAMVNGKEIIAPLFSANDLTVGSLVSKAQPTEEEETEA